MLTVVMGTLDSFAATVLKEILWVNQFSNGIYLHYLEFSRRVCRLEKSSTKIDDSVSRSDIIEEVLRRIQPILLENMTVD